MLQLGTVFLVVHEIGHDEDRRRVRTLRRACRIYLALMRGRLQTGSYQNRRRQFQYLVRCFGDRPVAGPWRAQAFSLLQEHLAPPSVCEHRVGALSLVLKRSAGWGWRPTWLDFGDIARPGLEAGACYHPDEVHELESVLQSLHESRERPGTALPILASFHSGCTLRDIGALTWNQVADPPTTLTYLEPSLPEGRRLVRLDESGRSLFKSRTRTGKARVFPGRTPDNSPSYPALRATFAVAKDIAGIDRGSIFTLQGSKFRVADPESRQEGSSLEFLDDRDSGGGDLDAELGEDASQF